MADAGLFVGRRVELIRGEVIEMTPQNGPHATAVGLVDDALRRVLRDTHHVRCQMPLALADGSAPEPDIAVVPGSRRDFEEQHPTSAELVVEVADSSLAYDRSSKASVYAEAGISEYWIVDLEHGRLEVHRDPRRADPLGSGYTASRTLLPGDEVEPLCAPGRRIAVVDCLP